MKYAKMLGLAAVAAMAVMAFVGASSASATVLCTTNANCTTSHNGGGGQMYDPKDTVTATASGATLTSSLANITCGHSEVQMELTSTGSSGNVVEGKMTSLSFTNCQSHSFFTGTDPCEDIELEPGWSGSVTLGTSAPNGTMTTANASVEVDCPGVVECTFGHADLKLPLTGGSPATVTANKVELNREGGGFCPEDSFWDATYKTSGAVWVQNG